MRLWLLAACACLDEGAAVGLAVTAGDDGPIVRFDLDAAGFPDIPFPNDIGTRPDDDSPTGRRVNVATHAATLHEQRLRHLINGLDGFGTYGPMWVSFTDRIDVADLHARQSDTDPDNDAVVLLEVATGTRVALEFGPGPNDEGRTRRPLIAADPTLYFPQDPRSGESNILLETVSEETDTDGDGVIDKPNVWGRVSDAGSDGARDLLTCYELETDTLLLRPRVPLRERAEYAVVLTRDLRGVDGAPVRSPFPYVHHLQQTESLRRLPIDFSRVAFAWTFTTQSIATTLNEIRAGLYGRGPRSTLASRFPARLAEVPPVDAEDKTDNIYLLSTERLVTALNNPGVLSAILIPEDQADALAELYRQHVAHFVFARFESPAFLQEAGVFARDPARGDVYVNCAIPKATPEHQPPFDTVFYNHGSGSTRLELLGFAANLASHGLASCAMDAYGHGLIDNVAIRGVAESILAGDGLQRLGDMVFSGRSRDLNGDGYSDSGGDFWTADLFRTRDSVRQTVVDYMQLVRIVRQFGKATMPVDVDNDGNLEVAGDFDGDGVHDLGGDAKLYMMGQSLGGIVTALLAALEPEFSRTAPVAAGGGLADIAARSIQPGMLEAVHLGVMGPLLVGDPVPGGGFSLSQDFVDVITQRSALIAKANELRAGDTVQWVNRDNGEVRSIAVRSEGFRIGVPTDTFDRLQIRLLRGGQVYRTIDTFELSSDALEERGFHGKPIAQGDGLFALQNGFGLIRQTPAFRRMVALAQWVVDPADPINYARDATRPMLMLISSGDPKVPTSTGVALAREIGLLSAADEQLLVDKFVVEGVARMARFTSSTCHYDERPVLFDIDDASNGADSLQGPTLKSVRVHPTCTDCECAARAPLRATDNDSGVRFMYLTNVGGHSFRLPDPTAEFDYPGYYINLVARYFATGQIVD
jgi:hypothetical protein